MQCEVCGHEVAPRAARKIRSDVLCVTCLEGIHRGILEARRRAHGVASSRTSSSGNGKDGHAGAKGRGEGELAEQVRRTGRVFRLIAALLFLLLLVEVVQLVRAL